MHAKPALSMNALIFFYQQMKIILPQYFLGITENSNYLPQFFKETPKNCNCFSSVFVDRFRKKNIFFLPQFLKEAPGS